MSGIQVPHTKRWVSAVVAGLVLAACGQAADGEPLTVMPILEDEGSPQPATATPTATATEAVDAYRALLTDIGSYPCQLLPEDEVRVHIIPAPENPPTETSVTDDETGSITGICDYEGLVRLTVFIAGPDDDVQASYDQALPPDTVSIDNREPPRLWGLEDDTLYILDDGLWYGLTISTEPEKDRLFDAVELYGVVTDHLPSDPSLPTATPIPTRVPVTFIDPCALLTRDEVETQIGPLSEKPISQADFNPVSGSAQTCIYYADLNSLIVTAYRYDTPSRAQEEHQVWSEFGGAERPGTPNDDTIWLPDSATQGVLRVLQGNDILEVRVDIQGGDAPQGEARSIALALAPGVLERLIDPLPTPTPGPTAIPLNACDLMSRAEAEAILGALSDDPQPGSSVGEGDELGPLYTQDCSYAGAEGSAFVSLLQGIGDDHARLIYERFESGYTSDVSPLSGVGDAAFVWAPDEFSSTLVVLDGRFVISVFVSSPEPGADARAVITIVTGNLP